MSEQTSERTHATPAGSRLGTEPLVGALEPHADVRETPPVVSPDRESRRSPEAAASVWVANGNCEPHHRVLALID